MKLQKKHKFNFWNGENPLLFLYKDNDFRAKENFVKKTFLSHNKKFQYHCFVDEENKKDFGKHRNRLLEILKNF